MRRQGNAWVLAVGLWATGLFAWPATPAYAQSNEGAPAVTPPQAPPSETPVPAAPSNYALPPPPPPPSAPRYPAAPDLAPREQDVEGEAEVAPTLRIPAHVATRLRVLSTDLNTLAARGGGGVADGVFSIITGGVLVTLGVVFWDDMESMAPMLVVFGGASVGRGLIDLIVMPNPYDAMLEYSHMPMTSVSAVKARLRYGERTLEELSDRNRLARMLDAAVSMGAAATLLGLTLSANSQQDDTAMDESGSALALAIGIIGASTLAVGGIISLLSSSDAERRWAAYQGLRERLAQERALERDQRAGTSVITAHVSPVLSSRLLGGALTVRF